MAKPISDKISFKIKTAIRDKEGHRIMIKGSIQDEDITIVNIYASTIGAPKYIKQMLLYIKGEINSNTITVRDFNTSLTSMDRSSRQKISKETLALNDTLDEMDLMSISIYIYLYLSISIYPYIFMDIYPYHISFKSRIHILFKCT